ncbi:IS110 family transposase [Streptosporangium canum]|uniref:IS110 family transposase n=1 Tax=Streptosporangium canum TaxID=324952 RepID=UPI003F4DFBAB
MNRTDDRLLVLGGTLTKLFCGIDWAEHHHDIAIVDDTGVRVAKARISNDSDGLRALLELPAGVGDHPDAPIPVAIEKPHGLPAARCVAGLAGAGAVGAGSADPRSRCRSSG